MSPSGNQKVEGSFSSGGDRKDRFLHGGSRGWMQDTEEEAELTLILTPKSTRKFVFSFNWKGTDILKNFLNAEPTCDQTCGSFELDVNLLALKLVLITMELKKNKIYKLSFSIFYFLSTFSRYGGDREWSFGTCSEQLYVPLKTEKFPFIFLDAFLIRRSDLNDCMMYLRLQMKALLSNNSLLRPEKIRPACPALSCSALFSYQSFHLVGNFSRAQI